MRSRYVDWLAIDDTLRPWRLTFNDAAAAFARARELQSQYPEDDASRAFGTEGDFLVARTTLRKSHYVANPNYPDEVEPSYSIH